MLKQAYSGLYPEWVSVVLVWWVLYLCREPFSVCFCPVLTSTSLSAFLQLLFLVAVQADAFLAVSCPHQWSGYCVAEPSLWALYVLLWPSQFVFHHGEVLLGTWEAFPPPIFFINTLFFWLFPSTFSSVEGAKAFFFLKLSLSLPQMELVLEAHCLCYLLFASKETDLFKRPFEKIWHYCSTTNILPKYKSYVTKLIKL